MSRTTRPRFPKKLSASLEIVGYLVITIVLVLLYCAQAIDLKLVGIVVLVQLLGLAILSWVRLGQGRHPAFVFLGLLPLFQAGRLIAAALGSTIQPYQIDFLTPRPFGVSTLSEAILLLSLSLSAICIYAPCRWSYRLVSPEPVARPRRGLTYLYMVFYLTLPFVILENSLYLRFANSHGGYLSLFIERANLIASVPLPIRADSDFLAPTFLAIFVLEKRKLPLYTCITLYFLASSIFLLIGSRSGLLTMLLALWCVSRIKSRTQTSQLRPVLIYGAVILAIAMIAGSLRDKSATDASPFSLTSFIAAQGTTMSVTEIAIQYRERFSPYIGSYLWGEIENAFAAFDQSTYIRGSNFADDVTVFLSPEAYSAGVGTGSSYLGEAYVAGALPGVILVSLLLGLGLNWLYLRCTSRFGLFVSAVMLPSILWMARAGIFEWVPTVVRNSLLVFVIFIGWKVYQLYAEALSVRWEVAGSAGQALPGRVQGERLAGYERSIR